jgi:hypothetical protein
MAHNDEAVPLAPALEAPGDRLVPWANTPRLPSPQKAIPALSTSSSFQLYGTPRA